MKENLLASLATPTIIGLPIVILVIIFPRTVFVGFCHETKASLAHFLPQGTPMFLIPILVIIETISLFVQPVALAVRLTASITTGHLLIHLIGGATLALINISLTAALITFIILILLTIPEFAVALIQGYLAFTYTITPNDPPNPCISYSQPQSLTTYGSPLSPSHNTRTMMMRYYLRKHSPRPSYTHHTKRTPIRLAQHPNWEVADHPQASPLNPVEVPLLNPSIYFTLRSASEYYEAPCTISHGVYGSTFFVATGFPGLHVIISSTFLIVCFLRQLKFHFTSNHHFIFEAAA
ncbi:hypothetical protein HPG69_008140 [Diceros bicornis minor]|uniref:Cytochrome c oxidase subunit 3 n=1 Tax=Diceros bicornis minor TaxID=77932 RepID=A0A7J7F760_DICBM|nr:hypothetical protein HPG69_008140 [Diceros bicornis minor]